MKSISITTLFLLISFLGFFSKSHSRLLQDTPYSGRVLQSSGDLTLPRSSVDIDGLFTLYFEFDSDYITMAIQFKIPNQYFSIGFGTRMDGADMWIFQLVDSAITSGDYIGSGYSVVLDTDQGGANDLEVLGYEVTSSYSLVKVKRALNTGDPNDAVIEQGFVDIVYATGESPTLTYHGRSGRGQLTISLIQGTITIVEEDTSGTQGASIEDAHSIVNLVAWGALVDVGILVVRLFRGSRLQIGKIVITVQLIHTVLMMSVIIMSAVVTGLLIKMNRQERGTRLSGETDTDFHFINGLVMLFLIIVTMFLGFVNLLTLKTYKRRIISRYAIKNLHRILGLLLYLCAKANIITGALIYNEGKWRIGLYTYLVVLLLVHVALQIFYAYKNQTPNKAPSPSYKRSKNSTHLALLEAINQGTPREELIIRFPKLKWVILGNRVYDLTGWMHPGGNFIIQACIGREVGRYFFGNYALEGTQAKPHTHSSLTVSQMQQHCIGEISHLESLLVKKSAETETVSLATDKWKITSITSITGTVSEVSFQCPDFEVKNFGESLSWLGRHFKVSQDYNSSDSRLYTTAMSLTLANFNLRQSIYQYFEEIMSGNTSATFAYSDDYLAPRDDLPLFIKDYATFPYSFSHMIHTTKLGDSLNQFRVEGPLGRGLELTPNATGTHFIVCAGTGVLPFVDFLNLFLWKTMYDLIKETAGVEKAESINVLNIPFDTMFNEMNIVFLGAFPNAKEVLGLDIIAKLAEISQKYNLNTFTGMMKGYSDTYITEFQGQFSEAFLNKLITKKEERFYVVGPPRMNRDVPKILEELGIQKEKIVLV